MYLLKRLLAFPPLLVVISLLAFALVRLAPGGPFDRERAPAAPEIERQIRAKYHLDEPFWKQYTRFLADIAQGDFGVSLKYRNQSVNDVIRQGLPVSFTLGALAFGLSLGLGIPLGYWAALRHRHWDEYATSFFTVILVCVPGFVVGPILILCFGIWLRWFPVALWGAPSQAVLPVLALGLYYSGRVARLMREGMLANMNLAFVTAARARGLGEHAILIKHVFRLAVLPVVSYSGPLLADLLAGAFVVENIFQIPGLGTLLVNGSLNRDYTLVVGLVMLYAILLAGMNLAVDLAYVALDPRVRYE